LTWGGPGKYVDVAWQFVGLDQFGDVGAELDSGLSFCKFGADQAVEAELLDQDSGRGFPVFWEGFAIFFGPSFILC